MRILFLLLLSVVLARDTLSLQLIHGIVGEANKNPRQICSVPPRTGDSSAVLAEYRGVQGALSIEDCRVLFHAAASLMRTRRADSLAFGLSAEDIKFLYVETGAKSGLSATIVASAAESLSFNNLYAYSHDSFDPLSLKRFHSASVRNGFRRSIRPISGSFP